MGIIGLDLADPLHVTAGDAPIDGGRIENASVDCTAAPTIPRTNDRCSGGILSALMVSSMVGSLDLTSQLYETVAAMIVGSRISDLARQVVRSAG